jgi:hypothetical protein
MTAKRNDRNFDILMEIKKIKINLVYFQRPKKALWPFPFSTHAFNWRSKDDTTITPSPHLSQS